MGIVEAAIGGSAVVTEVEFPVAVEVNGFTALCMCLQQRHTQYYKKKIFFH
jgi:hypothetical protein